jgi:hypothetical protein
MGPNKLNLADDPSLLNSAVGGCDVSICILGCGFGCGLGCGAGGGTSFAAAILGIEAGSSTTSMFDINA